VISVIVPIRNEDPGVAESFRRFVRPPEAELVVADSGARPETGRAFDAVGGRRVCAPGTRGRRLALAATEARGEILLFLHADSRPAGNALAAAADAVARGAGAGAFGLAYESATPALRWIAWWANRRSRWLKLPFGDQGIFCRREVYERCGGFRDLPVCDDLDLVRRLRRLGKLFVVLPETTVTSGRRFRERGALRQVLRDWRVQLGYFAGVPPEILARWYEGRETGDGRR
jgi:rSAM/selenodomain-associated transferase 2